MQEECHLRAAVAAGGHWWALVGASSSHFGWIAPLAGHMPIVFPDRAISHRAVWLAFPLDDLSGWSLAAMDQLAARRLIRLIGALSS